MLTLKHNLKEFNRALIAYQRASQRDWHNIIVKKARDVSLRLAGRTQKGIKQGGFAQPIQADVEDIEQRAQQLGYKLRRRLDPSGFVPIGRSGLSQAAEKLGQMIASGFRSSDLSGSKKIYRIHSKSVRALPNKLNLRAAMIAAELMLRKQAARAGTLAASWITRWRKAPESMYWFQIKRNKGFKKLAKAKVNPFTVTLKAFAPGLKKYEWVIVRALRDSMADIREYIQRKAWERWTGKRLSNRPAKS